MNRNLLMLAVVVVLAAGLTLREMKNRAVRHEAATVVRQLGGHTGSLVPPFPFSGHEIRITFAGPGLSGEDLPRLRILQQLAARHHVGVLFRDTHLTDEDIARVCEMLPDCSVHSIVDGERQQ
ncbi:hypothetical protein Mal4_37910 [Maioricimonas rarisocia]|uniref:Uncharacterized protein n=1 Tax=Maioricimonas rarisocia TaxID=2528026 RepID=A0A517ZAD6_9PLAN|nr:hypothetical protein [Maioricimonas rarisocia]QDU39446.1 hypothetical protein Mal4_37910 [Maioricimonas rarisocia]